MKFKHKVIMVSAMALIGLSPVAIAHHGVLTVQAAKNPTVKLTHNAYVYDSSMNNNGKIKKGKNIKVDQLQYFGKKAYYHINDQHYPGTDQWIKKSNAVIVKGKKLIATNQEQVTISQPTIATLAENAYVYTGKGAEQKTKVLGAGTRSRINQLLYIWVPKEGQADLFYQLQSAKDCYIKIDTVQSISGPQLKVTNTAAEAKDAITPASDADKAGLAALIDQNLKNTDTYKLSSLAARNAYDKAVTTANNFAISANSTVDDINKATAALKKATSALDGKRILVADPNNLTDAEMGHVAALATKVSGINLKSNQFVNNNSQLLLTGQDDNQQVVYVSDYVTTN